MESRSWVKPAVITVILVVVALGVAALLVRRNGAALSSSGGGSGSSGGTFKPVVTPKGWTQGNTNAKTILVEFGDYQCGACAAARLSVAGVMKNHGV